MCTIVTKMNTRYPICFESRQTRCCGAKQVLEKPLAAADAGEDGGGDAHSLQSVAKPCACLSRCNVLIRHLHHDLKRGHHRGAYVASRWKTSARAATIS